MESISLLDIADGSNLDPETGSLAAQVSCGNVDDWQSRRFVRGVGNDRLPPVSALHL